MKYVFIFMLSCLTLSSVILVFGANTRNPTLLISLDGFRADKLEEFLKNNPNSYLQKEFVDVGLKAEYSMPSFPSLTFPNHFTIVTGLHPESHGITGNSFYDPIYDDSINFMRDADTSDVKWWNESEPIWYTAKKQNLKTSSFFWTGSEAWPRSPDIFFTYNKNIDLIRRCDEVVTWFEKFQMDFTTLYFNEPDSTGHSFGPDSIEYANKIKDVDNIIGYLLSKLNASKTLDNLNILIVSDHGMASMKNKSQNGTIIVKNYLDMKLIDESKTIYGVVSNFYPKNQSMMNMLYQALKTLPNTKVYLKENIPAQFNYKKSSRIAPIVAISDEGYSLLCCSESTLQGNHGFDNQINSMRAIFLARGPDFKKKSKIGPIKTVDIYPLLCELLKIQCNPNNGTIEPFLSALSVTTVAPTTATQSTIITTNKGDILLPKIIFYFMMSFLAYQHL